VHTTLRAGVPLNGGVGVDDLQFFGVLGDAKLVAWHNCDLREQRPRRFPALGASAHMIVCALARYAHLNRIGCAFAVQRTARKVGGRGFQTVIYCRMNWYLCHGL
jgi:hypothetical protein